jgi:hypothetical protein
LHSIYTVIMKRTFLYLILLLQFVSFAQKVKSKEKFTKTEIISFLKVYQYKIDHPFEPLQSAQDNASKIKISQERLTEIFQNQFASIDAKITKNEQEQLDVLKTLVENDKKVFDENLKVVILQNSLTEEKYNQIKSEYNNNESFQRRANKLLKVKK